MTTQKELLNKTVKVLNGDGLMASLFIGQTGKVTAKCGLYRGAVVVKIGDNMISYYPQELEVINASR